MTHKFEIYVANDVGINAAILYDNISWWCAKNMANKKNFNDGNYWTYMSTDSFKTLFPYMTKSMIRTSLKKLIDKKYIASGNYNKVAYDRTKWFCDIRHFHLSEIANGSERNRKPIPSSTQLLEEEVVSDISQKDFIALMRKKYIGKPLRIDDVEYYFASDGYLKTFDGDKRVASGRAMDLYKRLYAKRVGVIQYLEAKYTKEQS